MEEKEQSGGLHCVGKKDELIKAKRSFRTLEDAGGTLENGDIEDINGKLCIICPKHKYKITLAEGEGLYRGRNPMENPPVLRWYSKGVKQRVHTVTEKNGEVFVKLVMSPNWIDSDYYQGEKGKLERAKAEESEEDMPVMKDDDDE
ncbi:Rieske domain-containing protein isoform 2-T2 [Anableps anableps]